MDTLSRELSLGIVGRCLIVCSPRVLGDVRYAWANDRAPVWPNNHHPHPESGEWSGERSRWSSHDPASARELIKLNFMFLEKQDNYAPTFTQLAFNSLHSSPHLH